MAATKKSDGPGIARSAVEAAAARHRAAAERCRAAGGTAKAREHGMVVSEIASLLRFAPPSGPELLEALVDEVTDQLSELALSTTTGDELKTWKGDKLRAVRTALKRAAGAARRSL